MTTGNAAQDPFHDTHAILPESSVAMEDALNVGRDVSMTLGTDSLVVLDEASTSLNDRCCGLNFTNKPSPTTAIPYHNILWAEVSELYLIIHYALPVSKDRVTPTTIRHLIDKTELQTATNFCTRLLNRAYRTAQRKRRIRVLINPHGGQGNANKLWNRDIAPIFAAAQYHIEATRTEYSGHAVEIAQSLDIDSWDVIACISGDGVPHEVFNGLSKRQDAARALKSIAVVQLPAGSGNAMSFNLNGTGSPSLAALALTKGLRMPMDLMSVTQGDKRYLSFLSQAVGIIADVDLGTESLRWMGSARFTIGVFARLMTKTVYPADIAVKCVDDDKSSIKRRHETHKASIETSEQCQDGSSEDLLSAKEQASGSLPSLKYGTVQDPVPSDWETIKYDNLGNFYAGNMAWMTADGNFFPAAMPNDGCIDLVTVPGDVNRLKAVNIALASLSGDIFAQPDVKYRKVEAYRITPRQAKPGQDGYISIDGESEPFEPFQVEIHRGLGTVIGKTKGTYESPPVRYN